jgi:hypothetical protein
MTDTDLQSKLAEHEDLVRQLAQRLQETVDENDRLRGENAKLRAEKSDALSVLKEIYSDPDASQAHRIKAAGLALPHEVPRLTPVAPAIDATCEEIEPLAVVMERQRRRMNKLLALPLEERSAMITGVSGNGSDDDTAG